MVGADHFRRRVDAIYVAGWATWPVTVVAPRAVILVEARGAGIWNTMTISLVIMQIKEIIQMNFTTMGLSVALHLDTQMGCVLFTMSGVPGPDLMQVVEHVGM